MVPLTMAAGAEVSHYFEMKSAEPPGLFGAIVGGRPIRRARTVAVDGRPRGVSPVTVADLTAGRAHRHGDRPGRGGRANCAGCGRSHRVGHVFVAEGDRRPRRWLALSRLAVRGRGGRERRGHRHRAPWLASCSQPAGTMSCSATAASGLPRRAESMSSRGRRLPFESTRRRCRSASTRGPWAEIVVDGETRRPDADREPVGRDRAARGDIPTPAARRTKTDRRRHGERAEPNRDGPHKMTLSDGHLMKAAVIHGAVLLIAGTAGLAAQDPLSVSEGSVCVGRVRGCAVHAQRPRRRAHAGARSPGQRVSGVLPVCLGSHGRGRRRRRIDHPSGAADVADRRRRLASPRADVLPGPQAAVAVAHPRAVPHGARGARSEELRRRRAAPDPKRG